MSPEFRRSMRTACQGPLSMDEAAELLRVDRSAVEEASRSGQLPTVRRGNRLLIDGPQLLDSFLRAAHMEATDAS